MSAPEDAEGARRVENRSASALKRARTTGPEPSSLGRGAILASSSGSSVFEPLKPTNYFSGNSTFVNLHQINIHQFAVATEANPGSSGGAGPVGPGGMHPRPYFTLGGPFNGMYSGPSPPPPSLGPGGPQPRTQAAVWFPPYAPLRAPVTYYDRCPGPASGPVPGGSAPSSSHVYPTGYPMYSSSAHSMLPMSPPSAAASRPPVPASLAPWGSPAGRPAAPKKRVRAPRVLNDQDEFEPPSEVKYTGSGSSSKYRGVFWDNASQAYRSKLKIKGRTWYLGIFQKQLDAARTYDAAARYVLGPSALVNFKLSTCELTKSPPSWVEEVATSNRLSRETSAALTMSLLAGEAGRGGEREASGSGEAGTKEEESESE